MNKRGQLTIFIIVAILIIVFGVIYFLFIKNPQGKIDYLSSNPIYNFVQECFESTAEEVIYQIGQGGGYYSFYPEKYLESGTPIYLNYEKIYVPSKEDIEEDISASISTRLPFCIKDFNNFLDYEISYGNISVKTEILNETTKIEMDYPIFVSKEESTDEIKDFNAEIPVRLGIVYQSVLNEINSETEQGICLSCVNEILEENDLYLEMFNYKDVGIIFIWTDRKSEINGEYFEYVYANTY